MAGLIAAKDITALAGILTPGIIILWLRGRFRDTAMPKISGKAISYSVVSIAYTAVVYPLFHATSGVSLPTWLWTVLLHLFLPVIVGFALAFFDNSELFYAWTERIGLRPVHHSPTAWDYTFRNKTESFAIVHLTDGSIVTGAWTGNSFASSTGSDRDILLAQLWTTGEDGSWSIVDPPRSMLICGGAIRMVEFIQGGSDEQQ
ncbi:hypothetical protein NS277_13460 [Novosphingobium barchaimii]|nr:hypothetical protein NS277_13460 [Novosphingobium barchaimii]